ncbi:MAG: asparagine synthase (glutamine-hydrolyzing) [Candidatus Microgenomates bacterium]
MCGIAGIAYFKKDKEVHREELKLMASKIVHRGPDDEGIFISKNKSVGFASKRLAIIDLSQKGHQPMTYLNRYTITFNGEIYNFQEERQKLIGLGYKFNSESDTEVVLALYSKYHKKCLDHLRGMFAFAIYDEVENTIFLARDRIGKKPLKYLLDDTKIIFASELKAILTQVGVKKKVDYEAINLYLNYGYTPAPMTGFEGIKKLEPANYIFINLRNKSVEKKRYWEPVFKNKLHLSEKEWCTRILDTLEEATRIRMISDVPVGAFLSGGVDSSGVVAAMARLSDKPVKTFTIGFSDKDFDESQYAANIAKKYKTDHHVLIAKPQSTEILPFLAKQYEEPFADASNVVTYMVSKMTRKYVTVALNGDGGDENFAGYPNRYMRLRRDVDYDFWIQSIRPVAAELLKSFPKAKNFFEKAKLPLYSRFASYNKIFSPEELMNHTKGKVLEFANTVDAYEIVDRCFRMFNGKDLKDAGLKFDLLYFLPDQLLTKVDIASMAVSLEARSPLLDQNMIELACKIPFNLKVKNGESKYILKKAFEKIVPKENLYRPKMGFTIPLSEWFSVKLNSYAKNLLINKNSQIKEMFDMEYVKGIIEDNNRREDFGPRLWALMCLELWLQSYFT